MAKQYLIAVTAVLILLALLPAITAQVGLTPQPRSLEEMGGVSISFLSPPPGQEYEQHDVPTVTVQATSLVGIDAVSLEVAGPSSTTSQAMIPKAGNQYEATITLSEIGTYIFTATGTSSWKLKNTVSLDIEAGPKKCDGCSDCSGKLDGTYDQVILTTNIDNHVGTCIEFFASNILFNGGWSNGHYIDGDNIFQAGGDSGIDVDGFSNVIIQNVEVKEFNDFGVDGTNANVMKVQSSYMHHNDAAGIWIQNGGNSIITDNLVERTTLDGLVVWNSAGNQITDNTISLNFNNGILFGGSSSGADQNVITENQIFGNGNSASEFGVKLRSGSDNNQIYHNNFVNNFDSAEDSGSGNSWDNGYPDGGNYWIDFSPGCTDQFSGVNQDQAGSDGICDSAHTNGLDSYPWKNEFGWDA